jgi:hypothetical protein
MLSFASLTRRPIACLPMARFACDLPVLTAIEYSLRARTFDGVGGCCDYRFVIGGSVHMLPQRSRMRLPK